MEQIVLGGGRSLRMILVACMYSGVLGFVDFKSLPFNLFYEVKIGFPAEIFFIEFFNTFENLFFVKFYSSAGDYIYVN